jgi:hypothetical protein
MNRKQASAHNTRLSMDLGAIFSDERASEEGRARLEILLRNESDLATARMAESRAFEICTDPKLPIRWIAKDVRRGSGVGLGVSFLLLSHHPFFVTEVVDPASDVRPSVFMEAVSHVFSRISEAAYKLTFDRSGTRHTEASNTGAHWRLIRTFLAAFDERWEKSPVAWGLSGRSAMWSKDAGLNAAYVEISRLEAQGGSRNRMYSTDNIVRFRADEMDGVGIESVARLVGATRAVWAEIDRLMVPPEVLAGFPAGLLRRVEGPRPWNLDEMYAEPGIASKVPMPLSSLMIRSRLDRPYEPIFPEQTP